MLADKVSRGGAPIRHTVCLLLLSLWLSVCAEVCWPIASPSSPELGYEIQAGAAVEGSILLQVDSSGWKSKYRRDDDCTAANEAGRKAMLTDDGFQHVSDTCCVQAMATFIIRLAEHLHMEVCPEDIRIGSIAHRMSCLEEMKDLAEVEDEVASFGLSGNCKTEEDVEAKGKLPSAIDGIGGNVTHSKSGGKEKKSGGTEKKS